MEWAGITEAPSELSHTAVCVDVPFVCPRLKCGTSGRLPSPEPAPVFFAGTDISGVASAWGTNPHAALLNELSRITIQGSAMYLDADRSAFVADFATLASDLDSGKLLGNCHGRLVIGPKGTGKSTLLQALVLAVQRLASHTIAIWVDAAVDNGSDSPALAIKRALEELLPVGLPVPPELAKAADAGDISRVLDVISLIGLRVLLIVDEYATVFSRPACDGARWTRQLYAIGQRARSPQAHMVVLSGSAPYMRSMCFGKLSPDPDRYPSYAGRSGNLNSERFQVRTLGPIVTMEGLQQFIRSWEPPRAVLAEEVDPRKKLARRAELDGFFVATGGNHRRMDDALRTLARGEAPPRSWYKVADQATKFEQLWRAMLKHLVDQGEEDGKRGALADDPWSLLRWIPWSSLGPDLVVMSLAERYAAADDGAIVFDQSMSTDRVRFVAPIQPLLLQERGSNALTRWPAWFDPYLRTCLRFPYGVLGIDAEAVFRRSIVETGWDIRATADGGTLESRPC